MPIITIANGNSLSFGDSLDSKIEAMKVVGIPFTPTKDELFIDAYRKAFTNDEFIEAVFEYLVENKPEKLLALQKLREEIKTQLGIK